jgi:hypothetical protein
VKSGKGLNRWKEFTWLKCNAEENLEDFKKKSFPYPYQ